MSREYPEYDGYTNRPTWDVALVWRNDQDSYNLVQDRLAGQPPEKRGEVVQKLMTREIERYLKTGRFRVEAARLHLRDILSYQIGKCNWVRIHNMLLGDTEKGPGQIDQFDQTIIAILQEQGWQHIVEGIDNMLDRDSALSNWFLDMLETWTDNLPARNSTLTSLARMLLEEDQRVTDWNEVAESFLTE